MDHGVRPNKEVGPNLVNWANSGLICMDFQVKDLMWDLGPTKGNGHNGL